MVGSACVGLLWSDKGREVEWKVCVMNETR